MDNPDIQTNRDEATIITVPSKKQPKELVPFSYQLAIFFIKSLVIGFSYFTIVAQLQLPQQFLFIALLPLTVCDIAYMVKLNKHAIAHNRQIGFIDAMWPSRPFLTLALILLLLLILSSFVSAGGLFLSQFLLQITCILILPMCIITVLVFGAYKLIKRITTARIIK